MSDSANTAVVRRLYESKGDPVIALGHYDATTKTGAHAQVRFIHLWTVRDGKLARLQQAGDSATAQHVLNG